MRASSKESSLGGGASVWASSFLSIDRLEGAADRMGAGEAGLSSFSGVVCAPPPPLASKGWILMEEPSSPQGSGVVAPLEYISRSATSVVGGSPNLAQALT